jgi:hypothetical protein
MHPNELTLNDYVDNALGPIERDAVERHVGECAACRAVVDDLREIARATRALGAIEPPPAVWQRLEQDLRKLPAGAALPQRPAWMPQSRQLGWLAAAAALVLAVLVGLRMGPLAPGTAPPPAGTASTAAAPAAAGDPSESVESELRQAEEHYDKAIKGLEQIANAGEGALDPATAATLRKNLSVIDQAISESRAAVHSQPNSEPAQASLLDNFRAKIGLLQDTVALINEMRKGNDAGAARIVSGLKQKGE